MKARTASILIVKAALGAAALSLFLWLLPLPARALDPLSATVEALEGDAGISRDGQDEKRLTKGETVNLWETVTTGEKSKILLRWDPVVQVSMGEFSSVVLSRSDHGGRTAAELQIGEGIVRVAAQPGPTRAVAPYSVTTPTAAISPEVPGQPADFIVEMYEPSTTVITVVSGSLRVKNLTNDRAKERIVSQCHTVYVDQGKEEMEILPASSDNVKRLAHETTISGTLYADLDACEAATAAESVPSDSGPVPPPAPRYRNGPDIMPGYPVASALPFTSSCYWTNWDYLDFFPYGGITVLPHPVPGLGFVFVIPGAGRFYVSFPIAAGWAFDPVILVPYVRYIFAERALHFYRDHLWHLRTRERELHHLAYLSQMAGHGSRWRAVRRELDELRLRADWTDWRIRQLRRRARGFESEERRVARRVPHGLNIRDAVYRSFQSNNNANVVGSFRNRLRTHVDTEQRLAGMAGSELTELRSRLARERDPRLRSTLRTDLAQMRRNLAQGKIPIPQKQAEMRSLASKLAEERDAAGRERLRNKLMSEVKKIGGPEGQHLMGSDRLDSLKRDIARVPDQAKRQHLEGRLEGLRKSFESRAKEEPNRYKQEEVAARMGMKKNREDRESLQRNLVSPGKLPAQGLPGATLPSRERARVRGNQFDAKPSNDRRSIENRERLRQQTERLRQQRQDQARQGSALQRQESAREQQLLRQRRQEEDRRKSSEASRVRQQEQQRRAADFQRRERLRQQDLVNRQQREQRRQAEQKQHERARRQDIQRQQMLGNQTGRSRTNEFRVPAQTGRTPASQRPAFQQPQTRPQTFRVPQARVEQPRRPQSRPSTFRAPQVPARQIQRQPQVQRQNPKGGQPRRGDEKMSRQ